MSNIADFCRQWEVRPTLRLPDPPEQEAVDNIEQAVEHVRDMLRQDPKVAIAYVGLESGEHGVSITATIVLAQSSTPGAAADEATNLLATACAAVGLQADVVKEIVVEMANVDPRSL